MTTPPLARPGQPSDVPAPPVLAGTVVRSSSLFASARTVLIEHAGQHYQLRITRENKLILTK